VHFTSTDPGAKLPADYPFQAGDQGSHTFPGGVTLYKAGTQAVTATDTATPSITGSATVSVIPAAASALVVTTGAANPDVAGTPFDVTVTAMDPYGNIATGYTGTVHFTSTDPGAKLPADYPFQTGDQGSHTFPGGATLYKAGTQAVTATDTVAGFNGSASVSVKAAPAVAFMIIVPPSVVSGTPFNVTVVAVDAYGNTDTNYAGTVHFTTSDTDPGVVLPPDYAFQPGDAGMVTFPGGVTLITAGSQTITVTDTVTGITGSATVMVMPPGP
jgi:hypothetical protein